MFKQIIYQLMNVISPIVEIFLIMKNVLPSLGQLTISLQCKCHPRTKPHVPLVKKISYVYSFWLDVFIFTSIYTSTYGTLYFLF